MGTGADIMQPGDRVLLQARGKDAFMSKKIEPEGTTSLQMGAIRHSEIIGKRSRDTVRSSTGHDIRAYLPTLAEYVTLTPRRVTPVYPSDANLIVSLLDINVETHHYSSDIPPLEILEAGTGHASLTLHLARAVHAGNQLAEVNHALEGAPSESLRSRRQAIIHTIDISPSYSQHAQQIVSGFRRGMYSKDIDFHVGDVSQWVKQQFAARGLEERGKEAQAFLSHAVLDMPDAHDHVETVASALLVNGGLLVFNPSITQIMTVVRMVKERYLPLQLERVLELGQNMTGGKEWDVRCVKPRARIRTEVAARNTPTAALGPPAGVNSASDETDESIISDQEEESEAPTKPDEGWESVCRPKVGYRISGGGFVAFFKKMKK